MGRTQRPGRAASWLGAGLAALGMLAAGCGAAPDSQAAPAPVSTSAPEVTPTPSPSSTPTEVLEDTLGWEPCGHGDERFQCATLAVPVDHRAPDGPTLDLAVVRLPAPPAANRIGALVVNPGGPGGSGVNLVRYGAIDVFPAELRTRFDIVGFDPRGVGESRAIACATRSEELVARGFAPQDGGEWAAVAEAARAFAEGCTAESGELLEHVSTADVVADLDLLRHALGEPQLTFVGFSYGTHIGARYAERHPERVRAMVLDGAVDPALNLVADVADQARALEEAFDQFLAECVAAGCPLAATGDPGEVFERVQASVASGGLQAPALGRAVSATDLHLVVTGLLRDRETGWPWLGLALAEAAEGDGSAVGELAALMLAGPERGEHDQLAALWAVSCSDLPAPPADAFPALADELAAAAPRFGVTTLALHLPCAVWPVAARAEPAPVAAAGAPRMLVVGVTGDPVTPYHWSESLAEQLDARLVRREGARHTAFGAGNVCTDRAVSRYLIDLVLPVSGWSCG